MTCPGSTGDPKIRAATSRDLLLRCRRSVPRRHGRRRADALHARGSAGVPEPAHSKRDVGALTATVGVQLVEHEEPQVLSLADQPSRSSGPGEE